MPKKKSSKNPTSLVCNNFAKDKSAKGKGFQVYEFLWKETPQRPLPVKVGIAACMSNFNIQNNVELLPYRGSTKQYYFVNLFNIPEGATRETEQTETAKASEHHLDIAIKEEQIFSSPKTFLHENDQTPSLLNTSSGSSLSPIKWPGIFCDKPSVVTPVLENSSSIYNTDMLSSSCASIESKGLIDSEGRELPFNR